MNPKCDVCGGPASGGQFRMMLTDPQTGDVMYCICHACAVKGALWAAKQAADVNARKPSKKGKQP